MNNLVYQNSPIVTLATNTFVDVPIILQFDQTPLISLVHELGLGITTEIPIYHSDGTYLAKVRGTRIFATEAGKKAGLEIRSLPLVTVCSMGKNTVFEIQHQGGDAFKANAELYTPSGHFVRCDDSSKPGLFRANGDALTISGLTMSNCSFRGVRIGILLNTDGSMMIGAA